MPSSEAINRGPQPVLRRSSQTRSWSASSVSEGWWWGAEERSRRQLRSRRSASPASRQRVTQVWAVDFATFEAAAAASNERPPSSTSATRRRLPFGVSGALRCCIRVLLEVVSFEHPQPLGGPGSISWRSERGEARQLALDRGLDGGLEPAAGPGRALHRRAEPESAEAEPQAQARPVPELLEQGDQV